MGAKGDTIKEVQHATSSLSSLSPALALRSPRLFRLFPVFLPILRSPSKLNYSHSTKGKP